MYGYRHVCVMEEQETALRQGQDVIEQYAMSQNYQVIGWFSDIDTTPRHRKAEFNKMLLLLKSGKADGVIVYKPDHNAGRPPHWSHINMLINKGVDVHFTSGGLSVGFNSQSVDDVQITMQIDLPRNSKKESFYKKR